MLISNDHISGLAGTPQTLRPPDRLYQDGTWGVVLSTPSARPARLARRDPRALPVTVDAVLAFRVDACRPGARDNRTPSASRTLTPWLTGRIISAMSLVYTTPPHLRPIELWRVRLADGTVAHCTLGPTNYDTSVAWYLNGTLQSFAGFERRDHEDAESWAEDVRQMLTAPAKA